MSLDSALRRGLIAAGDSISVETTEGMQSVVHRIEVRRKRQVVGVIAVALTLLAITVVSLRGDGTLVDAVPELPPARDLNERIVERHEAPRRSEGNEVPAPASNTSRPGQNPGGRATATTAPVASRELGATRPRPVASPVLVAPPAPRLVTDSYRVERPAGTHMGENAGLGCTEGAGVTGADDCFQFEVGANESALTIEVVDDAGIVVPFHITEQHQGSSRDLGSFCGATPERISVSPGALLLVRIEGTDACSDRAPTSGRLHARFWQT